jgi:hypothetical protein
MQADLSAQIAANISRGGQPVVGVWASSERPPEFQELVYTTGNYRVGLRELRLIGDCDDLYVNILNIFGENIFGEMQRERGKAFQRGEIVDDGAPLSARIVDAGKSGREELAVQAGVFNATDTFAVSQILQPEQNGRYLGDPAILPPRSDQPVLTDLY